MTRKCREDSFAVTYLANDNPLDDPLFLNGQFPSGSICPVKKAKWNIFKIDGAL